MIYVGFNKRSCVTAKEIKDFINSTGGVCRTINRKGFARRPDVFIRYGNSYKEAPDDVLEINSLSAVRKASNKADMARALHESDSVSFPEVWWPGDNRPEGYYYFRNMHGKVVYRNHEVNGDVYATRPIERSREFRVHVFSDKIVDRVNESSEDKIGNVMGVYEKIPHEEGQLYCKNDNCDFKRIDMSDDNNLNELKGIRPMAKNALDAIGLDFGGVDVIISKSGDIFVNEVNSAPSLNTPNVERFVNIVKKYIR